MAGFWSRRRSTAGAATAPTTNVQSVDAETLARTKALIEEADYIAARALLESFPRTGPSAIDYYLLSAQTHRLTNAPKLALAECELALDTLDLTQAQSAAVHRAIAQCKLVESDVRAAIEALDIALALDDANGATWFLQGECWQRLGDHALALKGFQASAERFKDNSDKAKSWFSVGQCLMYLVDVSGAYTAFQKSIELDADLLEAEIGLGNAALWLDREPEAIALFESAVRRSSQPGRLLLLNLGTAYQFSGRFDDAQRMFSRVMAEHPYDHSSRWYLCQLDLSLCRWQEGWFNYSSRFAARAATYRPTPFKPWDGSAAPADVLLILADEGIGDEILYASCFADAARLVRHLVIECEPRLEGLFKRSFAEATVIPSRREVDNAWLVDAPKPDWHIPSGNLPGLFRRADSSFPDHTGYLTADPARVEYWRTRLAQDLGPGLKVGISWRGGTVKTRARARTLSPEHFGPILSVPGVRFVSLQYGDYASELASLRAFHGVDIHDYPEAITDYDETAALVIALDLVITVCTAVVHLAGALGKPVWILTPLSPGWRYTATRTSMPWYPSSRIFRQKHYDEWLPVCREVSDELTHLTKIGRPIGQLSST